MPKSANPVLTQYKCVELGGTTVKECEECPGMSNKCGAYKNKYGLNFYDALSEIHKYRAYQASIKSRRNHWRWYFA